MSEQSTTSIETAANPTNMPEILVRTCDDLLKSDCEQKPTVLYLKKKRTFTDFLSDQTEESPCSVTLPKKRRLFVDTPKTAISEPENPTDLME